MTGSKVLVAGRFGRRMCVSGSRLGYCPMEEMSLEKMSL